MRPHWLRVLLAALVILSLGLAPSSVRAEDDAATAEVRAAGAAYLSALQKGDAAKIKEFWTDDGVYIDADGKSTQAKELATKQFTEAAAPGDEPGPASIDSTIRIVGPAFAIEQGAAAEAPGDAGSVAPRMQFIAAWVKQQDRWRLNMLREFLAAPGAAPAPEQNPLGELQWLVGSWSAVNGTATIELTSEWTPEKKFLIQQFAARRDGRTQRSGTQRIGWDPVARQVRSWTFNADGSFSEARWRKEGGVWVAEAVGALADGRSMKSVHFWMPDGEGACWFKSFKGEVDGQAADDLVLKFSRQATAAP